MTKGNWSSIVLNFFDYRQISIVTDVKDEPIAHLYLPNSITDEDLSNAKVLSNAKNMFELLKNIETQLSYPDNKVVLDEWDRIKKDIEKLDS